MMQPKDMREILEERRRARDAKRAPAAAAPADARPKPAAPAPEPVAEPEPMVSILACSAQPELSVCVVNAPEQKDGQGMPYANMLAVPGTGSGFFYITAKRL